MLYCIIDKYTGDILGRFKTEEKTVHYFIEFCQNNNLNVKIKPMTKEEYPTYTKQLIAAAKDW